MKILKNILIVLLFFAGIYYSLDYASRDSRNFTINGQFEETGEEPIEFDVYKLSNFHVHPEFWFHYTTHHQFGLILDIREEYIVRFTFRDKVKYMFVQYLKGGKKELSINFNNKENVYL